MAFSAWHWTLLMLSLGVGFLALVRLPATDFFAQLLVRSLFVGVPLGVLAWLAGRQARAIFGRFTGRDAWAMVLAALLAILSSLVAALVLRQFAPMAPNAVAVGMGAMSAPDLLLNLLSTLPQLLGEEVLTILPFLAVLHLASTRWGLARGAGIALALTISTLIFCAAHLPTYQWNWVQCFGVIGAPRVVLTLAYVVTRKLWVSTGAHVLTDWTEFTVLFALADRG